MSSKVQREKAEKKRQTIQNDILDRISVFAKENKDKNFADVLSVGDKYIQELIRKNPQDKTLITSASLNLRRRMQDWIKKMREDK